MENDVELDEKLSDILLRTLDEYEKSQGINQKDSQAQHKPTDICHQNQGGKQNNDAEINEQSTTSENPDPSKLSKAALHFIGFKDGKQNNEKDERLFKTWYSLETVGRLIHSFSNKGNCFRCVFYDDLEGGTDRFLLQIKTLIKLQKQHKRPVVFIAKAPLSKGSHYITGILYKKEYQNLFIIDPEGSRKTSKDYQFYEKIKDNIEQFWFSNTPFQRDSNGASCGPLAVELVRYLSNIKSISSFFKTIKNKPISIPLLKGGLVDLKPNISGYLSHILSSKEENYTQGLEKLREVHLKLLIAKNEKVDLFNSAEQKLMFRICNPDEESPITTSNWIDHAEFKRLYEKLIKENSESKTENQTEVKLMCKEMNIKFPIIQNDLNNNVSTCIANIMKCSHHIGLGTKEVHDKSLYFYFLKKHADQGDALAKTELGIFYEKGQSVKQDYAKAASLFQQAADQNQAIAQSHLGVLYEKGQGVKQDYTKAASLYKKAADQGESRAQTNLGLLYKNGLGVKQEYKEALNWFTQAANQGNAQAKYNIGFMYENGLGILKDCHTATFCYQKASDLGSVEAAHACNRLRNEWWSSLLPRLNNGPSIRYLNLSHLLIPDWHIETFKTLTYTTHLYIIDFGPHRLTQTGIEELAETLLFNKTLKEIHLTLPREEKAIRLLAHLQFLDKRIYHPKIPIKKSSLNLSYSPRLARLFLFPYINYDLLQYNNWELYKKFEQLPNHHYFKQLSLNNGKKIRTISFSPPTGDYEYLKETTLYKKLARLTPSDYFHQLKARLLPTYTKLYARLKELSLNHTHLGNKMCSLFITALKQNKRLSSLSLAYNQLTFEAVEPMKSFLKNHPTLKILYLQGNKIDASLKDLKRISIALKANRVLQHIDISYNYCNIKTEEAFFITSAIEEKTDNTDNNTSNKPFLSRPKGKYGLFFSKPGVIESRLYKNFPINQRDTITPTQWVVALVCPKKSIIDQHAMIYLEGMWPSGQRFIKRYDLVNPKNSKKSKITKGFWGKASIRDESCHENCHERFHHERYHINPHIITPAQANKLETNIKQDVAKGQNFSYRIVILFPNGEKVNCLSWAIDQLKEIDVIIEYTLLPSSAAQAHKETPSKEVQLYKPNNLT